MDNNSRPIRNPMTGIVIGIPVGFALWFLIVKGIGYLFG